MLPDHRHPRRRCACALCTAGFPQPVGMEGLATLPAADSPRVQELAQRALLELRTPLKAEELRRQLRLPYGDASTLLVARVLRVLGARVEGDEAGRWWARPAEARRVAPVRRPSAVRVVRQAPGEVWL